MATFEHATLGRSDEPLDLNETFEDLEELWMEALRAANYKPTRTLDEDYYDKFNMWLFRPDQDDVAYERRAMVDVHNYFCSGDDYVREAALAGGIDSMLDAYFDGVPLEDILA